jgi:imidazole glycerol-phosphate synthase subunit HisH
VIAILHYGLGNVDAIANIYKRLGIDVALATSKSDLSAASRIILPGVGAFDWAMSRLNDSGMRDSLEYEVGVNKKPLLGICVGMQMLARSSDEGRLEGLGWVDGEVKRFDVSSGAQLPHMGWNDVEIRTDANGVRDGASLFRDLSSGARFYFLHSYYFKPASDDDVLAVTDYTGTFASSVRSGNIYGVQFHPEKSHQWGIQLLKNFATV